MTSLAHLPTLKGMTWSHARGYDPMVATAAEWQRQTGIAIHWDKRSLQDFETFPVEELARRYDLIVIDHPHVGQITAQACLAPLEDIAELRMQSVGKSYSSYNFAGQQWAYPIDAAAQVMAYRADLLPEPPTSWNDVVALARTGAVVLPMLAPHSLMALFTLAANLGHPCAAGDDSFIDSDVGIEVIWRIKEVASLVAPSNFAMDPIAACEAMCRADAVVACMPLGYGYVSYARDGFRARRLSFVDIPLPDHSGSALGGTGIAVSAFSAHRKEATDYARWVASGDVQRGLYALSGGQPAHAAAWNDEVVNADANNFYRATRKTLSNAWVRPRHRGYMAFQDFASRRLNAGLLSDEAPAAILADLDVAFRESF